MQFHLSNLLDLALGTPNKLNCENFNLLHTLLHVVLRKLDLADSYIELSKETTENNKIFCGQLPKEPLICFKEYILKPGGHKIMKRSSHTVGPRKSLIHISKKWPKCCPHVSSQNSNSESLSQSSMDTKCLISKFEAIIQKLENRISKVECDLSNKLIKHITNEIKPCCNDSTKPKKCELKVNIRNDIEGVVNDDSDSLSDEIKVSEIDWLKTKMFELSESLKLHSNCLKRLKCEEVPKIQELQKKFLGTLEQKCAILDAVAERNQKAELNSHFEKLEQQIFCLNEKFCKFNESFIEYKKKTDDEMCTIWQSVMDKSQSSCNEGEMDIVETENEINLKKDLPQATIRNQNNSKQNFFEEIGHSLSFPINKTDNTNVSSCHADQHNLQFILSSIKSINQQVSSQNESIHQLTCDLSSKIDRCEFKVYCRELKDIVDIVNQLKRDFHNSSTAAGCTIPLMRNMNCMSCQATTNMMIKTTTLPKLPSLNFGYESFADHDELGLDNNRIRNCKDNTNYRSANHTKIMRCTRMRYKRIGTPLRCSTPLITYKNRYRKTCSYY